jgi:hypothetical protein
LVSCAKTNLATSDETVTWFNCSIVKLVRLLRGLPSPPFLSLSSSLALLLLGKLSSEMEAETSDGHLRNDPGYRYFTAAANRL